MLYFLNSPVLTGWGGYKFQPISLRGVRKLLAENPDFISAVGHESTAEILTTLLGITIPMNRTAIKMQVRDRAIVFRLKARPAEGKILNISEIEQIGYEFGLLTMRKPYCLEVRL